MLNEYVIYLSFESEKKDPYLKVKFFSDRSFSSLFRKFVYQSCMIISDVFWIDDDYDDSEFVAYLYLSHLKAVPLVSFLEFMNSCSCIYYNQNYGLPAVSKLYSDIISLFKDLPF